jgi:hypothetical protein
MPFAYYDRLSPARQRVYRKSDAIVRVELPHLAALVPLAVAIETPLVAGERSAVGKACQALVDAINAQLATPAIQVKVLERRPSNSYGELHGLYEPEDDGARAVISVWMRTARKKQVVKFRTFLRTLVHEVVHHLDYEFYKLPETFHTEGFYARESALVRALMGEAPAPGDVRPGPTRASQES